MRVVKNSRKGKHMALKYIAQRKNILINIIMTTDITIDLQGWGVTGRQRANG